MIRPVSEKPPLDAVYDYAVVGSGFGGSVAALRLTEKGYSVIVVEQGRRWSPSDFPKSNWSLRKFFWMPRLGFYGIQQLSLLRDVLVLHGSGVGGGSLVYANTLMKPDSSAFTDSGWSKLGDWDKILKPHYETARKMLGAVVNPRLTAVDETLRETAKRMGREETFKPTEVGVFFGDEDVEVPDPYFGGEGPARKGCTFCGGCMTGCRVGAKNTLDRNYLYLAEKLGARVLPETRVTLIKPSPEGGYRLRTKASTSLLFHGRKSEIKCRGVVLAAGVMGTVKLLLQSKKSGALPLLSDTLGKGARTNSEALLGVLSRDRQDLCEGIAISSNFFPDKNTRVEPVRYSKGSDVMCILGTPITDEGTRLTRPLKWLANCLRHPIDFLRTLVPFGSAKRTVILLFMQTIDNSIDLILKRRWFHPLRRALTTKPAPGSDEIPSCISVANKTARLVASGLKGIPLSSLNEVLLNVPTTAHILGGCAMGSSAGEGVADSQCRIFGYRDMYVVDGSVVGANLGVNPSLTITAIAEYAMSRIPPQTG